LAHTDHSRVLLERSIFCDRYVFAENCYRTGLMTETEYQLYCGMWDFLVSNYCVQPDLIVYLRTPADECLARIARRGREEESGIALDYLLQLERLHDEWLLGAPRAIVVDGSCRWTASELQDEIDARLEAQPARER
jgi:deoxyadenosine/deoxycytidine kinase